MSFTIFQNEKTHFQAVKTRSSKRPKMAIFPTFFFQAMYAEKISFTIFQKEKRPFQAIKTTSSKSPKIDIFPKGSTHGFGSKMAIFPTFFFRECTPGKCLSRYSRKKKTPFQAIKTRSLKSQKIDFSPKRLTHGFGPKMAIFQSYFVVQ